MQSPPSGLTTFSSDPPQTKSAKFSVGIRSQPYLADHGFADMIVLPGSFYIALALQHHREDFDETPQVLRNIRFQSVIYSDPNLAYANEKLVVSTATAPM